MTASSASKTRAHRGARRALVATALSVSAALALTACGAGQITQTATQIAAINGGEATSGQIALRNVQLLYPTNTANPPQADDQVELSLFFVAVNNSPDQPDTLESITVDGTEIQVDPVTVIGDPDEVDDVDVSDETSTETTDAGSAADAGDDLVLQPHGGLTTPLDRFEADVDTANEIYPTIAPLPADDAQMVAETRLLPVETVPVVLGSEYRAGNTVDVTFTFAKAGEITVTVPISAVHDAPRLQEDLNAERNALYTGPEEQQG